MMMVVVVVVMMVMMMVYLRFDLHIEEEGET